MAFIKINKLFINNSIHTIVYNGKTSVYIMFTSGLKLTIHCNNSKDIPFIMKCVTLRVEITSSTKPFQTYPMSYLLLNL